MPIDPARANRIAIIVGDSYGLERDSRNFLKMLVGVMADRSNQTPELIDRDIIRFLTDSSTREIFNRQVALERRSIARNNTDYLSFSYERPRDRRSLKGQIRQEDRLNFLAMLHIVGNNSTINELVNGITDVDLKQSVAQFILDKD